MGSFPHTSRAGSIFYVGSFSYTSRAGFIFMWGVSLIHPVLSSFLSGEFLLHIPCWFHFSVGRNSPQKNETSTGCFYLGSFPHTSRAGSIFYGGSFSYTSHDCFVLLWEVSLTLPMLASFSCGEFFLHIPYWRYFYLGTFSYTSLLAFFFFFFFFLWGVSLTHTVLALFHFYLGTFSYTSHAGFSLSLFFFFFLFFVFVFLMWGVSLTHPVLTSFLCGEILLHILC